MEINIETIIFLALLIDALGANMLAWSNKQKWWQKHFCYIARFFPLSRGWTTYYLILVLIIGALLYRFDALILSF